MNTMIQDHEALLNDFDPSTRAASLRVLAQTFQPDAEYPEKAVQSVNLHGHTFYSYNGYGYSPSAFAWRARRESLLAAGIVDFDVLDGVDEFLEAGRLLGLRVCAGIETRVSVPWLRGKVTNSPGEPGIAYYMGVGFSTATVADSAILTTLKATAQQRNLGVLARVNAVLQPVSVAYEHDVLSLTPAGNATERHLCEAYDRKARVFFGSDEAAAAFWAEKLGLPLEKVIQAMASPPDIQGHIRAKLMKAGGPGYVKPESTDFPSIEEVTRFTINSGAIPTLAFLDGTTEGERDLEYLLDSFMEIGVAAVNIIPDRSWNIQDPDTRRVKVEAMNRFVDLAQARNLPIAAGTEMNAYGQRFVDDFIAPEMQHAAPAFISGAFIFYAHTWLQRIAGMGYLGEWARQSFSSIADKNRFFEALGRLLDPAHPECLEQFTIDSTPKQILDQIQSL